MIYSLFLLETGVGSKISNILQFIIKLFKSFVDWIIELFDRISSNYRLVAAKLEEEMKTMKAKIAVSFMVGFTQFIKLCLQKVIYLFTSYKQELFGDLVISVYKMSLKY